MAPILEKELAISCFVYEQFDTDTLGTFSGEIERKFDALTTLRNKCILAANASKSDLVIASEGSFGAHPSIFFAHANQELVMLKDFSNDLEIIAKEISLETNFNGQKISNETDLLTFAEKVNFPSHALILKSDETNFSIIFKGIQSEKVLLEKFYELKNKNGFVYVETDMRAMFNPTRMKVIEKATWQLIEKIKSLCPTCQTPGFDIIDAVYGLPCELCKNPTRSTLYYLYQCKKCNHSSKKMFPRGITYEEPTYCDTCNP
ncbi:DUF6671 family protein [Flavobacterium sp.]|uniref:DUF6671 family protein n=1 Tax=Flavobacterium sp. TaxID=239 RepID=UPI0037C0B580